MANMFASEDTVTPPDGVVPLTKWDRDRIEFERSQKRAPPSPPPAAIVTRPPKATPRVIDNPPEVDPNPPADTRSWGERNSMGARPGGQRFGGATYGGNTSGGSTFGGRTYGENARPEDVAAREEEVNSAREARDRNVSERNWIPGAGPYPPLDNDAGFRQAPPPGETGGWATGGGEPVDAPRSSPDFSDPGSMVADRDSFFPPASGKVTPPGKPGGGGGGGARSAGRKPLGEQSRIEQFDPTLDRADPRNVGLVDDSGRANPKLYEDIQKKGAIDPTKPGVRTGATAQAYTNNYTSALANATKYMTETFHQKPGDPNQAEGYNALTFKGMGAPDQQTVGAIFNVVDPKNELQPKERMELATRAMHDWYEARGNPQAAAKVAAEMLQYGNLQAQALGKQAMQAVKAGDQVAAVRAIGQAYDWLPDGFTSDVKGNNLVIVNDKGQTVQSIPLDAKMIANLSTGLATGTVYWDLVQNRAGVQQKFGPPQQQPTQAVATTAPGAPTPVAPGRQPWDEKPDPGPVGPPLTGAAPVTPPGNRPAAPAPAAPGPAPTPQAAPTPSVPPAAPGPAPTPQAAPIDEATGQPVPLGDGGPSGSPAGKPAIDTQWKPGPPVKTDWGAKPSELKTGTGTGTETKTTPGSTPDKSKDTQPKDTQPKGPTLIWNKDDPDTVPIRSDTGKREIVRRQTYPMSRDVEVARQEIARADAIYAQQKDWLVTRAKTVKSTDAYRQTLDRLNKDVEDTHRIAVERHKEVLAEYRRARDANDAAERKDLQWHPLTGEARTEALTQINTKLEELTGVELKTEPTKENANAKRTKFNTPLRLMPSTDKQGPIREAILNIKALNPRVDTGKLTDHVLTMMTHVGSADEMSKEGSANGQTGPKASRFRVIGEDLATNPVVEIGYGNSRIRLHIPVDTLNDIKAIKAKSYKERDDALKKIKKEYDEARQLKADIAKAKGKSETDSPRDQRSFGERYMDWSIGPKPPERP